MTSIVHMHILLHLIKNKSNHKNINLMLQILYIFFFFNLIKRAKQNIIFLKWPTGNCSAINWQNTTNRQRNSPSIYIPSYLITRQISFTGLELSKKIIITAFSVKTLTNTKNQQLFNNSKFLFWHMNFPQSANLIKSEAAHVLSHCEPHLRCLQRELEKKSH